MAHSFKNMPPGSFVKIQSRHALRGNTAEVLRYEFVQHLESYGELPRIKIVGGPLAGTETHIVIPKFLKLIPEPKKKKDAAHVITNPVPTPEEMAAMLEIDPARVDAVRKLTSPHD